MCESNAPLMRGLWYCVRIDITRIPTATLSSGSPRLQPHSLHEHRRAERDGLHL